MCSIDHMEKKNYSLKQAVPKTRAFVKECSTATTCEDLWVVSFQTEYKILQYNLASESSLHF